MDWNNFVKEVDFGAGIDWTPVGARAPPRLLPAPLGPAAAM